MNTPPLGVAASPRPRPRGGKLRRVPGFTRSLADMLTALASGKDVQPWLVLLGLLLASERARATAQTQGRAAEWRTGGGVASAWAYAGVAAPEADGSLALAPLAELADTRSTRFVRVGTDWARRTEAFAFGGGTVEWRTGYAAATSVDAGVEAPEGKGHPAEALGPEAESHPTELTPAELRASKGRDRYESPFAYRTLVLHTTTADADVFQLFQLLNPEPELQRR